MTVCNCFTMKVSVSNFKVAKRENLDNAFYVYYVFTARCTLVQSAVLRSHVVCLSVCDVGEL